MFNLSKEEITFEAIETFCREWQEGIRVEYKQQLTKDIPKIVSSFANTQGGIFIIGVNANQTESKRYQTGKRWSCLSPKKLKAIYRIQ